MRYPADHKFNIRSHGGEFAAAALADSTQVLVVPVSRSQVVIIRFDSDGALLSTEEAVGSVNGQATPVWEGFPYSCLQQAPISVAAFSVPKHGVGIREAPDEFDEFLADPERVEPNPVYRERTQRNIRDWFDHKRFVLTTSGKEYWMNADGSVFAT